MERMLKEKGLKSISPQSLNEFITILHIKNKNVRGAHCWLPEITLEFNMPCSQLKVKIHVLHMFRSGTQNTQM